MPKKDSGKLGGANIGVRVPVTREHIEDAMQRNSGHCMIAEAIKAAMPHVQAVSVDLATIRFSDRTKGKRYIYLTPRRAQLALLDFDQGNPIEPFTVGFHSPLQVVNAGSTRTPDGSRRAPSRKKEGIARSTTSSIPVVMGGVAPPRAVLATGAGSGKGRNVTLASKGKNQIREYGLKQLKP